MLLKWIFLIALVYVAYRFWPRGGKNSVPPSGTSTIEQMLECAHCGIRFPEGEAVRQEGKVFCSDEHRLSWKQDH